MGPVVVGTDVGIWEGVGVGFCVAWEGVGVGFWVACCSVGRSVGLPEGLAEGFFVGGRMIVGSRLGLGIAVGDAVGGEIVGLGATVAITPSPGAFVGFLVGFFVEREGLFVGDALGAITGRLVHMFVESGAGVMIRIVEFVVLSGWALSLFTGAESFCPAPEIAVGISEGKGVVMFVGTMLRVGTKLGASLSGVAARLGSKVGIVDG